MCELHCSIFIISCVYPLRSPLIWFAFAIYTTHRIAHRRTTNNRCVHISNIYAAILSKIRRAIVLGAFSGFLLFSFIHFVVQSLYFILVIYAVAISTCSKHILMEILLLNCASLFIYYFVFFSIFCILYQFSEMRFVTFQF